MRILPFIASFCLLGSNAMAQQTVDESVIFRGDVVSTCSFNGTNDGILLFDDPNVSTTSAGAVQFTSNGGVSLSVATPTLTSFPTGFSDQNIALDATIDDGNGNQAGSANSGLAPSISPVPGEGTLTVSVSGVSDQIFVAGSYVVEVVVTCEFGQDSLFSG